ncbi:MAG TPA: type II toxin-antitoxin system prevent-host-death family antitoxin [Myxococcota bacterium]|nr:type II toxin-antitoxin system prevent-host-death family antitoxin [Myxococcota bacterium]
MTRWQLQEAKAKFSELIRRSAKEPQIVSKSGKDQAVILSFEDYQKLVGKKSHLVDYMSRSPLKGIKLDLTRDRTAARDIDL